MTRVESKYHIKVDVPSRTLIVHDPGGARKSCAFRVATARKGSGNGWAASRAPRGEYYIRVKIGAGPAGQRGFHFTPANGRNLLAGAAHRVSGARLDTHAHPLALRPERGKTA